MYDAVSSLVDDGVRFAAFPDGSVDTFLHVLDADGRRLSKTDFEDRITGARSGEFRTDRRVVEAGGQAVNAARQAHALGDSVRLDGCLDHPELDFPFETHSFGDPSHVDVHQFSDGDLVYATVSDAVADWSHEDFETVPDADAYFCGNWTTVDGMTDSLAALAGRLDGEVFVFDPGDVTDGTSGALRDCCAALAELDRHVDAFLSVNASELSAFADAFDVDTQPDSVREATGVTGVVRHERLAATAATREATVEVPNLETGEVVRQTGGGDRFGAGFAHGLAVDGGLEGALALGNCCASYYVHTGETGTGEALVEFAAEHDER